MKKSIQAGTHRTQLENHYKKGTLALNFLLCFPYFHSIYRELYTMFVNRCCRQASRFFPLSAASSSSSSSSTCSVKPSLLFTSRSVSSASTDSQQSVWAIVNCQIAVSPAGWRFSVYSYSLHPSKIQIQPSSTSCKRYRQKKENRVHRVIH